MREGKARLEGVAGGLLDSDETEGIYLGDETVLED